MGVFCFAPVAQEGCSATFHYARLGDKTPTVHEADSSEMSSTAPP